MVTTLIFGLDQSFGSDLRSFRVVFWGQIGSSRCVLESSVLIIIKKVLWSRFEWSDRFANIVIITVNDVVIMEVIEEKPTVGNPVLFSGKSVS